MGALTAPPRRGYTGPGVDATQRRLRHARRAADDRARTIAQYGADPGELEPCPYCGRVICDPSTCPADPATHTDDTPHDDDDGGYDDGGLRP